MSTGPSGPLPVRFEDGLRFLAAALALGADRRHAGAVVSAACDAIRCFLEILGAAAERHLPDPEGEIPRLREQCVALLTTRQIPEDAMVHALEAAKLARDQAARVLPALLEIPSPNDSL